MWAGDRLPLARILSCHQQNDGLQLTVELLPFNRATLRYAQQNGGAVAVLYVKMAK
jgi:hypothetical protein